MGYEKAWIQSLWKSEEEMLKKEYAAIGYNIEMKEVWMVSERQYHLKICKSDASENKKQQTPIESFEFEMDQKYDHDNEESRDAFIEWIEMELNVNYDNEEYEEFLANATNLLKNYEHIKTGYAFLSR